MAMRYFVLQKALWLDFLATVDYVKLFGQCGVYCVFFVMRGGVLWHEFDAGVFFVSFCWRRWRRSLWQQGQSLSLREISLTFFLGHWRHLSSLSFEKKTCLQHKQLHMTRHSVKTACSTQDSRCTCCVSVCWTPTPPPGSKGHVCKQFRCEGHVGEWRCHSELDAELWLHELQQQFLPMFAYKIHDVEPEGKPSHVVAGTIQRTGGPNIWAHNGRCRCPWLSDPAWFGALQYGQVGWQWFSHCLRRLICGLRFEHPGTKRRMSMHKTCCGGCSFFVYCCWGGVCFFWGQTFRLGYGHRKATAKAVKVRKNVVPSTLATFAGTGGGELYIVFFWCAAWVWLEYFREESFGPGVWPAVSSDQWPMAQIPCKCASFNAWFPTSNQQSKRQLRGQECSGQAHLGAMVEQMEVVLSQTSETNDSSATPICGVCEEPISKAHLSSIASRHLSLQYCLKELGIENPSAVRSEKFRKSIDL